MRIEDIEDANNTYVVCENAAELESLMRFLGVSRAGMNVLVFLHVDTTKRPSVTYQYMARVPNDKLAARSALRILTDVIEGRNA